MPLISIDSFLSECANHIEKCMFSRYPFDHVCHRKPPVPFSHSLQNISKKACFPETILTTYATDIHRFTYLRMSIYIQKKACLSNSLFDHLCSRYPSIYFSHNEEQYTEKGMFSGHSFDYLCYYNPSIHFSQNEQKVKKGKFSRDLFDGLPSWKTIDFMSRKMRLKEPFSLRLGPEETAPPPKAPFPCIELTLQTLPPTSGAA